ncbi:trimeric LpxA-like protein [Pseudovirgaria hyperparasitica]|uniref:Trimeric LpxA-like protein n=1 Tax=Pseudovirgaria hyperparasitica TaxID=470096 RepID=A0A6A6W080_9PEZI|nr:trimeric LpxA-like protein [Pseudovirgaria hyperparasitica]KAF2754471.1 trimeric LpxA-like protein [Pseudovirgaria hyperparasitica]
MSTTSEQYGTSRREWLVTNIKDNTYRLPVNEDAPEGRPLPLGVRQKHATDLFCQRWLGDMSDKAIWDNFAKCNKALEAQALANLQFRDIVEAVQKADEQKNEKYGKPLAQVTDPNFQIEPEFEAYFLTNVRIGKDTIIGRKCKFYDNPLQDFTIGNNCTIGAETIIHATTYQGDGTYVAGCIDIGDRVSIGTDCSLWPDLKIGSWSTIGEQVFIGQDVSIGQGVYIGDKVIVRKNVNIKSDARIGNGLTIGAGNTVSGVIKENVPAVKE